MLVTRECPVLGDPMDGSLPASSVRWIFQARILEWVAISSSRGSSQPRDWACISRVSSIGGWIFYLLSHQGSPMAIGSPSPLPRVSGLKYLNRVRFGDHWAVSSWRSVLPFSPDPSSPSPLQKIFPWVRLWWLGLFWVQCCINTIQAVELEVNTEAFKLHVAGKPGSALCRMALNMVWDPSALGFPSVKWRGEWVLLHGVLWGCKEMMQDCEDTEDLLGKKWLKLCSWSSPQNLQTFFSISAGDSHFSKTLPCWRSLIIQGPWFPGMTAFCSWKKPGSNLFWSFFFKCSSAPGAEPQKWPDFISPIPASCPNQKPGALLSAPLLQLPLIRGPRQAQWLSCSVSFPFSLNPHSSQQGWASYISPHGPGSLLTGVHEYSLPLASAVLLTTCLSALRLDVSSSRKPSLIPFSNPRLG